MRRFKGSSTGAPLSTDLSEAAIPDIHKRQAVRERCVTSLAATTSLVLLSLMAARNIQTWICRINISSILDYGPAVMAWSVHGLRLGRPLYVDLHQPFAIPNPYPPVVPYLAWGFSRFFGSEPLSSLEGGRLLTILSTLTICAMIWRLAKRSGVGSTAAAIAPLAFAMLLILEPWGLAFRDCCTGSGWTFRADGGTDAHHLLLRDSDNPGCYFISSLGQQRLLFPIIRSGGSTIGRRFNRRPVCARRGPLEARASMDWH